MSSILISKEKINRIFLRHLKSVYTFADVSLTQIEMGASVTKYTNSLTRFVIGRKRKFSEVSDNDSLFDEALHTPKRKKLLRTSQYIFQALYKEGKNSDVTVLALGKSFNLHKVYLCQSPYFASMFGGSWLESTKNFIPIEIVDPQITVDALTVVFSSLYSDEVTLEPLGIIPVLATATLFQLEGIIEQCAEVMLETINPKTAIKYYYAGCEYGVQRVKDSCFKWLEVNLLTHYYEHRKGLRKLSSQLLADLVASPDLFVVQTEFSLYMMLKCWLYAKLHPGTKLEKDQVVSSFFSQRAGRTPFLETPEADRYAAPFRALRLKNLLLHHLDIEIIHRENIIPMDWLHPEVLQQWHVLLKVSHNTDRGPTELSAERFLRQCVRCGRVLQHQNKQMWRWTGFHFGLDLVVITDGRALWIKRNHRSENEQLLSFQVQRHVYVRVTVATLNGQRQPQHMQTTGVRPVTLLRNEEVPLLTFDKELAFPLLVSLNLMITTPDEFGVIDPLASAEAGTEPGHGAEAEAETKL